MAKFNTSKKELFAIGILVILYVVGIIGIAFFNQAKFLPLTPVNLMISVFIIFIFQDKTATKMWHFMLTVFSIGFLIEVVGINTGLPFGSYSYGNTLGPKIAGTPPIIGINWLMLIYCVGCFVNFYVREKNIVLKSAIGSGILLLLDYLIEPVAVKLDFWTWASDVIPIQNYISWYIIAFALLLIFFKFIKQRTNIVAIVLLALQFIFFGVLSFLL